jgi:hypothetical protein
VIAIAAATSRVGGVQIRIPLFEYVISISPM